MTDHKCMVMNAEEDFIRSTRKLLVSYKEYGDKTFSQVSDDEINWRPNEDSNSIAIIVHHMTGNMLSRFTNFLSEDGEKPWRQRDLEFENGYTSKAEMTEAWEKGWSVVFTTLDSLSAEHLTRTITIRNEELTVINALQRQLAHYAGHIGQMMYIATWLRAGEWKALTIARARK